MSSIIGKLRASEETVDKSKVFISACVTETDTHIRFEIPKHCNMSDLSETEKTLFAKVRANVPDGKVANLTVLDEETKKTYRIPVNNMLFFNLFMNWKQHSIAVDKPAETAHKQAVPPATPAAAKAA